MAKYGINEHLLQVSIKNSLYLNFHAGGLKNKYSAPMCYGLVSQEHFNE